MPNKPKLDKENFIDTQKFLFIKDLEMLEEEKQESQFDTAAKEDLKISDILDTSNNNSI